MDDLLKIDKHFTLRGEKYSIYRTELGVYEFSSYGYNNYGNNLPGLLKAVIEELNIH